MKSSTQVLWLVLAVCISPFVAPAQTATPTHTNTPRPTLVAYRNAALPTVVNELKFITGVDVPPMLSGDIDPLEYGGTAMVPLISATNASLILPLATPAQVTEATYQIYMTWTDTALHFGVQVRDDSGEDQGLLNESNLVRENDSTLMFFDPNRSRDARPQIDDFAVQFHGGGSLTRSLLSFGNTLTLQLGSAKEVPGAAKGINVTGETTYSYEARYSYNALALAGIEEFTDGDYVADPAWDFDVNTHPQGDPDIPNDKSPEFFQVDPDPRALFVWDAVNSQTVMHTTDLQTPFIHNGIAKLYIPGGDAWRAIGITALHGEAISPLFANWKMQPAYWLIVSTIARPGGIVQGLSVTRPENVTFAFDAYTGSATSPIVIGPTSSALLGAAAQTLTLNRWYFVKWEKANAVLRAKIWLQGDAEPANWQVQINDPPSVNPALFRDRLRQQWWQIGGQNLDNWSQLALIAIRSGTGASGNFVRFVEYIRATAVAVPSPGRLWGMDIQVTDNNKGVQWFSPGPGPVQQESPLLWGTVRFDDLPDYDRDAIADFVEVGTGTVPLDKTNRFLRDSDGDGLSDGMEVLILNGRNRPPLVYDTNPRRADTDGDRLDDVLEVDKDLYENQGNGAPTDPNNPFIPSRLYRRDSDGDFLPNQLETFESQGTKDADGDKYADGYEYMHKFDFTDASSKPPLGDINRDGLVTNLDALFIQTFFLGLVGPQVAPNNGWTNADLNRDGQIANLDALVAQSFFLGLPNVAVLPLDAVFRQGD